MAERVWSEKGFGLVELDLLATQAGATIPFPLRVPSFGRIPDERDVLFATALNNRRGTIDLVRTGPDGPEGAVDMVDLAGSCCVAKPATTAPPNSSMSTRFGSMA